MNEHVDEIAYVMRYVSCLHWHRCRIICSFIT